MRRLFPILFALLLLVLPAVGFAQELREVADPIGDGAVSLAEEVRQVPVATTVKLIVMLTALTLLPGILMVMTPFTRFIIVFSMLRQALGLQQSPPNQVLVALSFFLSVLIMAPTLDEVRADAVDPFMAGQMDTGDALRAGMEPMRTFMLANTRRSDLAVVMDIGRVPRPETLADVPTSAVISAFVLSELKTAFVIGVKIYIPFLVLDIIVANVLMGMGMMVLPPVVISLPFKLLLFVLMDGWGLLVRSLAASFGL